MAFTRIFTDDNGQTIFEDMPTPFVPPGDAVEGEFTHVATSATFRHQPVGLVQDWHTAPRRQFVITLQGMAEIENGYGEKRRFGPGDVLLADDLTGKGHITRVVGDEKRISVAIPIVQ